MHRITVGSGEPSLFSNSARDREGEALPFSRSQPIKKSHATRIFEKENLVGCGGALPFFGIIISEKGRFCQYHIVNLIIPRTVSPPGQPR